MALWDIASNNFHPGRTKLYTPNLRDPSPAECSGPCASCLVTLATPVVVRPALVVTPNNHLQYYKTAILCDKCLNTHLLLFIMLARSYSIIDDGNIWAEVTGTSKNSDLMYQTTDTSNFSFQRLISNMLSPAPPRYEVIDVPGVTEHYSVPSPPPFDTQMASALWRQLPDTCAKQSIRDLAMGCATNVSMKALCLLELVNYGWVEDTPILATTDSLADKWIPTSIMDEVD